MRNMPTRRDILASAAALALAPRSILAQTTTPADAQINIPRIDQMPNLPQPFKILNFKQIAASFDKLAFDFKACGQYLPLVWLDHSHNNIARATFGLPTYVGRKETAQHDHEAITCIAAVVGATLAGIDKSTITDANPHDWVDMCEAYFLADEQIVSNRTTGATGGSYWYDTFAQILFCQLVHLYPQHQRHAQIMRIIADRWHEACLALGAREGKLSFDHTGFRFADMKPFNNGKRTEPEGAAGAAWLSYMSYKKFGDPRHLETADWCMRWLLDCPRNPYYEVVLTFAVTLAARMNAELRRDYDVAKLINWCMGPSEARPGWGVITGRWGGCDVSGLSGSITDGNGYAFAMNTFVPIGAMLPAVRYDPRFARALGKWTLNAINAARLFYPRQIPRHLQSCPDWNGDPQGVICYEGLRRDGADYFRHIHRRLKNSSPETRHPTPDTRSLIPFASGDPTAHDWDYHTDFALYGAAHAGIFAAICQRTEDDRILSLDLLATDFFPDRAFPTRLLYNPYDQPRTIRIDVGSVAVDLYDAVAKRFVARNVSGKTDINLAADIALVLVAAKAGGAVRRERNKLMVDGVVVDYRAT